MSKRGGESGESGEVHWESLFFLVFSVVGDMAILLLAPQSPAPYFQFLVYLREFSNSLWIMNMVTFQCRIGEAFNVGRRPFDRH